MIQVIHFSLDHDLKQVKAGTFFAENSAAASALRAGLGWHGVGSIYSATIDPIGSLPLLAWPGAGVLLTRAEAAYAKALSIFGRSFPLPPGITMRDFMLAPNLLAGALRQHPSENTQQALAHLWDRIFDSKKATISLVRAAKRAGFRSMHYPTTKDRAGNAWLVIDPSVVSDFCLVQHFGQYTEAEYEQIRQEEIPES